VPRVHRTLIACLAACLAFASLASAQSAATIAGLLTPGYPLELVSARKADRIAWLAYERGLRNVYTASAPDFRPGRVTRFLDDDGVDISGLRLSDDGGTVIFVRGYMPPGRDPRTANPTSHPDGAERAIWAARTVGAGGAWRLAEGSNPVLSPGGRFVLFVRDGQIYRVPTASGAKATAMDKAEKPFIAAGGTNSNPRWSPDGAKVAFVSDRVDHGYIGLYDVRTRTATFVAPGVDRDTSPTWSPDGKRVAFIRRPGLAFGQQAQQGTGGIGNPQGPAYNPNAAQGRGQGFGQRGNMGGQAPPAAAQGRATLPGLNVGTFKGGYTLSFWVADIATGEAREFWHPQPNEFTWSGVNTITWAGDHVLFTAEPGEWLRFYAVSVAGTTSAPIAITPDEGLIEGLAFTSLSPDGRTLYYCNNAGDIDRRHVWKVSTGGGAPVQLTKGDDIETYPVPLASGKSVALLSAGATRPQSVGLVPAGGGTVKILYPTLTKAFAADAQVVPQNVLTHAEDGLEIHNQLFLPKDLKPGEKRPAMIFVHGGPVRQMLLGYHYMHFYHIAYAVNQWLASQGYVVLSVNYRGGVGYGRSFRNAPGRAASGNAEYQDVVAAGKYLQSRPDVDGKRIGIWGLSYGGLLTAQALARDSAMFCGGVDLAGVHLYTNVLDPENVAFKSSAVSQIEKWTSPVLLVHGDDDRNVAFTQTTGLVQMLRARNVPYELIVFPDDVHESLLYKRWLYTFDRMEAFLTRVVKGTGGQP
jgi:dipeptidyl aminopeptidase/acylaminoacyl peptidase